MANLIIKPAGNGSLILQDEGGDAALTVGTTGSTTLAGTANNVGTVTAGSIAGGSITNATTFPAGHVLQVLSATHHTEIGTTSTTYVALSTPMSIAITPSSASHKIWCHFAIPTYMGTANTHHSVTIYRGTTNLGTTWGFGSIHGPASHLAPQTGAILDSPSTTSSVTYQLYHKVSAQTGYCNINGGRGSITVMEIKV